MKGIIVMAILVFVLLSAVVMKKVERAISRRKANALKDDGFLPVGYADDIRVSANEFGYTVENLTYADLRGLMVMIECSPLPERRQFHALKVNIKKVLEVAEK